MKIVLNKCCGGFALSEEAMKELGLQIPYTSNTDERLIKLIEEKGSEYVSYTFSKLEVFDLPEETTDYRVDECNGYETVYYVVDGKIHTM